MSDALDDFLRRREQAPQAAARATVRAPAPPPEQAASIERSSRLAGIGWMAAVAADPRLGPDAAALFAPGAAIARRTSPGGSGPATAGAQAALLARETARLEGRIR